MAAAKKAGPRPAKTGEASSSVSRKSALHCSIPLSTTKAIPHSRPSTTSGRRSEIRGARFSAGAGSLRASRFSQAETNGTTEVARRIGTGWTPASLATAARTLPARKPAENDACAFCMIGAPPHASMLVAPKLIDTSSAPDATPTRTSARASCSGDCASPGSRTARPKNVAAKGKTLGPMRSIKSPVRNIAGRAAAATNRSATPRAVTDAPVCSLIAGSSTAHAPQKTPNAANAESEPSRVTAAVAWRPRRAPRRPPRSRSAIPRLPPTGSRTRHRTSCAREDAGRAPRRRRPARPRW